MMEAHEADIALEHPTSTATSTATSTSSATALSTLDPPDPIKHEPLGEIQEEMSLGQTIKTELKIIIQIIWPIVLTMILQMMQGVVVVIFVGQNSSTVELGATGIAVSYLNVFGVSIGYGLATACDTLCSQAYGGANKKVVGLVIQRGILILGIALFPCWAIWLCAEPILLALHQDPEVSRLTGRYCTIALPMLPAVYIYVLVQKFLQSQNIVRPLFVVGFIANVITIIIGYISVAVQKQGLEGAAVTHVCGQWLLALLSLAYLWYDRKRYADTWPAWSVACLYEWDKFVRLAIPGMLMLSLEWWTFELCQFLAGVMGDTFLAVQLIVIQIASFSFMVPLGLGIASSIRVGNLLGSNNPLGARRAAILCLVLVLCTSSTSMVIMLAAHKGLPRIWSEDVDVIRETARVLQLVAVFQLVDHTQGVFSGILRGVGLQRIGAIFNFVGYYILAMPIGLMCAFHLKMNVLGLWTGLIFGGSTQVIGFSFILFCRTNWAEEANKAIARSRAPLSPEENDQLVELTAPVPLQDVEGEDTDVKDNGENVTKSEMELDTEVPTDDEMIEPDGSDGRGLLNPKVTAKTPFGVIKVSKSLLLRRGVAFAIFFCIFLVGVIVKLSFPSPTTCTNLPPVANATHACNSFTSLLAGHTCGVECKELFVPEGVYNCSRNGTLLSVPSCTLK